MINFSKWKVGVMQHGDGQRSLAHDLEKTPHDKRAAGKPRTRLNVSHLADAPPLGIVGGKSGI